MGIVSHITDGLAHLGDGRRQLLALGPLLLQVGVYGLDMPPVILRRLQDLLVGVRAATHHGAQLRLQEANLVAHAAGGIDDQHEIELADRVCAAIRLQDVAEVIDGVEHSIISVGITSDSHPFFTGQKQFVDTEGRTVAASDSKAALPAGPYTTEAGWLRFALRGSPFSLVIYQPADAMASQALSKTWPMMLTGLLGLLATAGTALWLSRRFTQPALQLADYVQNAEGPNIKRPPKVPALWKPWFVRAGRAAIDRRDQLMHHHQRSSQLEKRVAQVEAQARSSDSTNDNHSKI